MKQFKVIFMLLIGMIGFTCIANTTALTDQKQKTEVVKQFTTDVNVVTFSQVATDATIHGSGVIYEQLNPDLNSHTLIINFTTGKFNYTPNYSPDISPGKDVINKNTIYSYKLPNLIFSTKQSASKQGRYWTQICFTNNTNTNSRLLHIVQQG